MELILIEVIDSDYRRIPVNTSCVFLSKVSVTSCKFIENRGNLLNLRSYQLPPCTHFIYIEHVNYQYNTDYDENVVISITNLPVHVSGHCNFLHNEVKAVMLIQSSHILFNGKINILQNKAENVLMFKSSTVLFNGAMTV